MSGYLDPASGSLFVSALTAGAAGIGVVVRTQLRRLGRRRNADLAREEGESASDEREAPDAAQ